jgi:two-component sensor histidine kinase
MLTRGNETSALNMESRWLKDFDQLQVGLCLGKVGVWRWRIGTDELAWTSNLESIHEMQVGSFDGTLESFRKDLDPEDADRVWKAIARSVATGEPYAITYRSSSSTDAKPLWIEAKGGLFLAEDGEQYLTGVCQDVTARVVNEHELFRRLKQQQGIQQLSTYALSSAPFRDVLQRAVETAADVFEVPLAKVLQFADSADKLTLVAGVGWNEGLVGNASVGTECSSQAGFTLLHSSPVIVEDLTTETRFSGPKLLMDHAVRSGMSVVIPGTPGRPFGVFGIHTPEIRAFNSHDIDALTSIANIVAHSWRQNEAENQQRLVLREMAHRSGNLLQIVSSLALQTFRADRDPKTAIASFAGRLESVARANQLISRGGWGPTRLNSLIDEVLGAYLDNIQTSGRDVQVPANLAFDLALILHELATNSLKHGALSRQGGRVNLAWRVAPFEDGTRFTLEWEDDQISPTAVAGTGFGSKLKRALVEQKWRGRMDVSDSGPYRFYCSIPLHDGDLKGAP